MLVENRGDTQFVQDGPDLGGPVTQHNQQIGYARLPVGENERFQNRPPAERQKRFEGAHPTGLAGGQKECKNPVFSHGNSLGTTLDGDQFRNDADGNFRGCLSADGQADRAVDSRQGPPADAIMD